MLTPVSPNPDYDQKLNYSQGLVAAPGLRTLHIAGQLGVDSQGKIVGGFEAQAHQAWKNLLAVLEAADMSVTDLCKVTAFLTDPAQYEPYVALRSSYLGAARPASTLLVVSALARPEWLFEIEATAMA